MWYVISAKMKKGEANLENKAPKVAFHHFVDNYSLSTNSDTKRPKQEILASRLVSSLASWTADKYSNEQEASQEI